jgi:hypothetical protein
MKPIRNQGLLSEVPPVVLYYGALWVLLADGIFAGMAAYARTGRSAWGLAAAVGTSVVLAPVALSRLASWTMSIAAAAVFGGLIYSVSALPLLGVIVTIQIGLMHLVAFAILRSHWRDPVRLLLAGLRVRTPAVPKE